jgi:hypothetical protein
MLPIASVLKTILRIIIEERLQADLKNHVRVCQESHHHSDSTPLNADAFSGEEGDDSQHSESAPYTKDESSGEEIESCQHHRDDIENVLDQSDIGETTIKRETFHVFSNLKSNRCFWQEDECRKNNDMNGGLRGIVWRSMFRRKLYDHTKISNIPDSRMLFNMSQHVMSNTFEQNEFFLNILQDV